MCYLITINIINYLSINQHLLAEYHAGTSRPEKKEKMPNIDMHKISHYKCCNSYCLICFNCENIKFFLLLLPKVGKREKFVCPFKLTTDIYNLIEEGSK